LVLGRRDGENARSTKIADWENHRDREHTRTKASYETIHHLAMGGYQERACAMNIHHLAMVATKKWPTGLINRGDTI
jgi:hypothetical protein